jgi:MoaA/NifB/PqqE/SkfB family radical SAM enzyme
MNNPERVIVWRVTQNCNMSCLFCSYSKDIKRQRDIANETDIAEFLKILGKYKEVKNQELLISWIGGEPFLWNKIIPFSEEIFFKYGIKISATTNGLIISTEKIKSGIIKNFSEIVFSLDGFDKCNDRIRQFDGHYEKVINNISDLNNEKKANNSKLIIKINTILLRENIDQFEKFCYKLAETGVNELTFNQLGGFDRPEFYQENRLLTEQVNRFLISLPELKEKFSKIGLKIHGSNNYLNRILSSTENKKIPMDECNPGKWFWFINENGFISPCSYTSYEYKLHINEIKSVEDIENAGEYFKNLRKTTRSRWCEDCHCTQLYDKFE